MSRAPSSAVQFPLTSSHAVFHGLSVASVDAVHIRSENKIIEGRRRQRNRRKPEARQPSSTFSAGRSSFSVFSAQRKCAGIVPFLLSLVIVALFCKYSTKKSFNLYPKIPPLVRIWKQQQHRIFLSFLNTQGIFVFFTCPHFLFPRVCRWTCGSHNFIPHREKY